MTDDLVTLRTFMDRLEAEIARELLSAHGIPSMLLADDCGGMRPYLGIGFGGVRLRVLRHHALDARDLLETSLPIPAAASTRARDALPTPAAPVERDALPRAARDALSRAARQSAADAPRRVAPKRRRTTALD